MPLKYEYYPDASQIPENFLRQIHWHQVEWWWAEPYDEYKICATPGCWRLYSIDDVRGSLQEDDSEEDFTCWEENCEGETVFIYNTEAFYNNLIEYIQRNVSMVLLTNGDELKGFWMLSQWNIKSVAHIEFWGRPNGYTPELIVEKLSQDLFWVTDASEEQITHMFNVIIEPSTLRTHNAFALMQELFFAFAEDLYLYPVVKESHYADRMYPIARAMWFRNVVDNQYWYVIQTVDRYSEILNYFRLHPWFIKMLWDIHHYREEAKSIIEKNNWFIWNKYYK